MAETDTSPAALRALADFIDPSDMRMPFTKTSNVLMSELTDTLRALAAEKEAGAPALAFADLRRANEERQALWCPDPAEQPDLPFRAMELGGEVGEALNVAKKLERERHGWRGSRATAAELADELADVVICADLMAMTLGVDLAAAVARKFNATSEKVGLPTRLSAPPAPDGWIPWEGGECPVGPEDLVRVKCRAGHTSAPYEAKWWGSWRHEGIDGDIVAYRVIDPTSNGKVKRAGEGKEIDRTFIKEHVLKKETCPESLSTNEWIEWTGGNCPVAEDAIVDVKFGDGEVDGPSAAGGWDWVHRTAGLGGDIIAYRLSKEG